MIYIKKNYTITGGTPYPVETIAFTSTAATDNPDGGTANLTIADFDVTGANNTNVLTISFPTFTKVGLYHFDIAETTGNTQGVSYNTESTTIKISVLIVYDYDNNCLKIGDTDDAPGVGITAVGSDKIKTDTLKNDYDMGTLTVNKTVTGNAAKKDQLFTIKVKFTATNYVRSDITVAGGTDSGNSQTIAKDWTGDKEITIKLMDGETVTISDIPAGVTYTVVEDSGHAEADPNGADGSKGYTISYENDSGSIAKDTTSAAKVKNEKNIEIDTGIALETVPYMLIMALALVGVALLAYRRREDY